MPSLFGTEAAHEPTNHKKFCTVLRQRAVQSSTGSAILNSQSSPRFPVVGTMRPSFKFSWESRIGVFPHRQEAPKIPPRLEIRHQPKKVLNWGSNWSFLTLRHRSKRSLDFVLPGLLHASGWRVDLLFFAACQSIASSVESEGAGFPVTWSPQIFFAAFVLRLPYSLRVFERRPTVLGAAFVLTLRLPYFFPGFSKQGSCSKELRHWDS